MYLLILGESISLLYSFHYPQQKEIGGEESTSVAKTGGGEFSGIWSGGVGEGLGLGLPK